MWCELALALGGRTINELKAAMTVDEFNVWLLYRSKWGISVNRSIELGSALITQAHRGGKLSDYLPRREEEKPQSPVTVQQAMALMPGKRMR